MKFRAALNKVVTCSVKEIQEDVTERLLRLSKALLVDRLVKANVESAMSRRV